MVCVASEDAHACIRESHQARLGTVVQLICNRDSGVGALAHCSRLWLTTSSFPGVETRVSVALVSRYELTLGRSELTAAVSVRVHRLYRRPFAGALDDAESPWLAAPVPWPPPFASTS